MTAVPTTTANGRKRPIGITVFAGLYIAAGVWCVIVPLLSKVAPNVLRAVFRLTFGASSSSPTAGLLASSLALVRFPLAIVGALAAVSLIAGSSAVGMASVFIGLGFGMWRLANPARVVTMVMAAWVLVRAALVSRPALEISPQAAAWSLWVAVSVAVLWYLVTPTVREAFRASSLPKPAQG